MGLLVGQEAANGRSEQRQRGAIAWALVDRSKLVPKDGGILREEAGQDRHSVAEEFVLLDVGDP